MFYFYFYVQCYFQFWHNLLIYFYIVTARINPLIPKILSLFLEKNKVIATVNVQQKEKKNTNI